MDWVAMQVDPYPPEAKQTKAGRLIRAMNVQTDAHNRRGKPHRVSPPIRTHAHTHHVSPIMQCRYRLSVLKRHVMRCAWFVAVMTTIVGMRKCIPMRPT